MAAIFPKCKGAICVSSVEDHHFARRYVLGQTPIGKQLYFCISTVRDEEPRARILSLKSEDLIETHLIVLDDVGTKVDPSDIKLQPSYKLETSPGNSQWGYILNYAIEPTRAAALIKGIAKEGFTDPGATGANRVMRVPGSVNRKYAKPFVSRLVEWHPLITYNWTEIASGFGVTLTEPRAMEKRPPPLREGETDPVFEWLKDNDFVIKGPNADGWHAIHCPWEHEHSGKADHGTGFRPGNPGAFKCLHGHCKDRKTASLRDWIKKEDPDADLGLINRKMIKMFVDKVGPLLEGFEGGGLFNLPTRVDEASLSPVEHLAKELRSIQLDPADLPDCDRTANGNPSRTQATTDPRVHYVMRRIGMEARLNVSTGVIECRFPNIPEYDPAKDNSSAAIEALVHACVRCGMKASQAIRLAVANAAAVHSYSPAADWILSKQWDGRSRISELGDTITTRDAAHDQWKHIAIRRWLLQTVAAIRNWELGRDAVDVGHVLVLQGAQGVGKSRWVGSLMHPKFVSLGLSLRLDSNERDAVRRVTTTPITELGEIDGSFRRSDVASLKNFLTTKIDTYRPPYGHTEVSRPRGTSFVATVNPEGFLIDQTGVRRFWSLGVKSCDWNHGIDMQQLWAEVWDLHEQGDQFWLTPDEAAIHAKISAEHYVESDVRYAVEDLIVRRGQYPQEEWIVANAKELAQHYGLKQMTAVYTDLYAALERASFVRAVRDGKRGMRVPPYLPPLSPAQRANLQLIYKNSAPK